MIDPILMEAIAQAAADAAASAVRWQIAVIGVLTVAISGGVAILAAKIGAGGAVNAQREAAAQAEQRERERVRMEVYAEFAAACGCALDACLHLASDHALGRERAALETQFPLQIDEELEAKRQSRYDHLYEAEAEASRRVKIAAARIILHRGKDDASLEARQIAKAVCTFPHWKTDTTDAFKALEVRIINWLDARAQEIGR